MNLHSDELEMSVLGSMILSPKAVQVALKTLKVSDFHSPAHRTIFDAIEDMNDFGAAADLVTLKNKLGDDLKRCGGVDYLQDLMEFVPSPLSIEHYAKGVKDLSTRRAYAEAGAKLRKMAETGAKVEEIRAYLSEVEMMSPANGPALKHISELRPKTALRGIPTGFQKLDSIIKTRGYPKGQMTIVSAYHKTGKSTFLCQSLMEHLKYGRVCYATFADLTGEDLYRRILRGLTGWDETPYNLDEQAGFEESRQWLERQEIYVYDPTELDSGYDVETFRATFMYEHAREPFVSCWIDHAGELEPAKPTGNRTHDQTECAKLINRMAFKTKIPFIVASQITPGKNGEQDITKDCRAWEEKAGWILRLKREGEDTVWKCAFSRYGGAKKESVLRYEPHREIYVEA